MKRKKIISLVLTICIMLTMFGIMPSNAYAATATLKVNGNLVTGLNSYVTVEMSGNSSKIAGVQFFVEFDTDAFSVSDVTSSLPNSWEIDWKQKTDAKYGNGILCMAQDSSLEGITDSSKKLMKIKLGDKSAQAGKEYSFNIYVIDVCDESGNSISSSFTTENTKITCAEGADITISDDVKIEGFQISYTLGGLRTISSVEPTINGKEVVEYGNIYAIEKENVTENDMYIGSTSNYVAQYVATELGILDTKFSESDTAINYIRTMSGNGNYK